MQTFKRREDSMQICLNNFQLNLVKMGNVLFVVDVLNWPVNGQQRRRKGEKKKETRRNGHFDFRILVIYVVFKLTIQVESTTTPRPEQFCIICTVTTLT